MMNYDGATADLLGKLIFNPTRPRLVKINHLAFSCPKTLIEQLSKVFALK
jgi:hypothetical protein